MFVYVDEAGNTGGNLFDDEQPWFLTIGLMTRANFDVLEPRLFANGGGLNGDFHANALGLDNIEKIAPALLAAAKRRDARFFASRLEKLYLATAKIVDTVFDSHENKAVPWHVYNLRHLRLVMLFKLAHYVLDRDVVKLLWDALLHKNSRRSSELFVEACKAILARVENLPDARSRELVGQAFAWAIENYENITVHTDTMLARYGHMPNMVAFMNLLEGMERQSKAGNRPIRQIKHDRQTQFEKSLAYMHELYANADPTPIGWPGMPPMNVQKAFGSKFAVSNRFESPGIQLVDIEMWLFGRLNNGDYLEEQSQWLMNYVLRNGAYNDFSFNNVYANLEREMRPIMEAPFSEEQLAAAKEMMARMEARNMPDLPTIAASRLFHRKAVT
jgi:hypothetical protein